MTNNSPLCNDLVSLQQEIREKKPLIHCITNPISINDCANIILAAGAKPIMAEHPAEVSRITSLSSALAVNLGNITDVRLASMEIAGHSAQHNDIPAIIDLVGIACSDLRLDFAKKFIKNCKPAVIKGNISELKALAGAENDAKGIDAGENDAINRTSITTNLDLLKKLAKQSGAVIVATGAADLITDGKRSFLGENGTEMLANITGTGCMLNALTAAYLASDKSSLTASLAAICVMGISGELAAKKAHGPGTFRAALLDEVYNRKELEFKTRLRLSEI